MSRAAQTAELKPSSAHATPGCGSLLRRNAIATHVGDADASSPDVTSSRTRRTPSAFSHEFSSIQSSIGMRTSPIDPTAGLSHFPPGMTIQRACASCAEHGTSCSSCEVEHHKLKRDKHKASTSSHRVQGKIAIGPVSDRYEQEADRVADLVMRIPISKPQWPTGQKAATSPVAKQPIAGRISRRVGRQVDDEAKEDEEDDEKELIQRMHIVQRQDLDTEEEDEDEDEEDIEGRSLSHLVQRQRAGEDQDEEEREEVQAKSRNGGSAADSSGVFEYVRSLRGGGEPMNEMLRDYFEPRFGCGFERVRIHADGQAHRSASQLNAKAYTYGPDIVFGAGQFEPHSEHGRRLLAHELTHVVQQGEATTSTVPALISDGAVAGIAQRDASPVVRRKPNGLTVGGKYVVGTKEGGNLRLRVQPTPDKNLHGRENCQQKADKCPNSVGNVKSGTTATIKEKRPYGWYVVEAATIDDGVRIGFVHKDYLKPAPKPILEGEYDEVRGICVAGGACEVDTPVSTASSEASDILIPEEEEGAPVFELGEEALESLEEGDRIEQSGVVETDDGTNLWPAPDPARKKPKIALLPFNTRVFVERKLPGNWYSVYVEKHQRGEALPVPAGTHGYVDGSRVNIDMPDPDAWFYRITKSGQGALELAAKVYPDYSAECKLGIAACRDHRYLVNVLVAVNKAKKREFIYKENPSDDWDKAKTIKATKDKSGKYMGGKIWVPGMALVNALHGQVSSGSISYEVLSTLGDIAIGVAGFIVGLLHGAVMSVADIVIGIIDLVKLLGSIIVKLFKRTLVADAKAFWEDVKKIKWSDIVDLVGEKWNHPNTWDKWHFRGYVIGYAIVEILLLIFSGGIATAVKWAGKVGKFGKIAKYLSELSAVKKIMTAAKGLKGKDINKVKAALKAAEALSEGHGWAARALRIPLAILRRLSDIDIAKLKKLPQWARERFARLAESAKLRLLGCTSPCKVDVDAIAKALKLVGKAGKKLDSAADVLAVLKSLNSAFKTAKISRRLRKSNSVLMKAIKEADLTDADLAKLADFLTPGDLSNPAQAYRTFVRYLTSVVPAKTGPDIKKLNDIMAKMVKAEARRGAAMKGAMFEQWVALHVPALASRKFSRITFNLRKLINKVVPPYRRHVDKWVPDKGEIWDMKHQLSKVPTKQADDYALLIGKAAPDGKIVKSVNYLFPTKASAELNKHLAKTYGFNVYYINELTQKLTKLF